MQKHMKSAILATVLATGVAAPTVDAAGSRSCTLAPRTVAAERDAARAAARREADESRVAEWLARRILDDVADASPVLDISAAEVQAATGIDAATLDPDRVRDRVAIKLRELAVGPTGERAPRSAAIAPAAPASPAPPAAIAPASEPGAGAAGRRAAEDSACGRTTSRN
jgi:hypothetical protein